MYINGVVHSEAKNLKHLEEYLKDTYHPPSDSRERAFGYINRHEE
jgi:hypothetical protein